MREFLKDVWVHGGEESRAITPENITGEKGRAAMSASHLGVGRKGSCCVPLESGETITLADIEGPGIIRHIWMTVPDKTAAGSFVMRDLVLRSTGTTRRPPRSSALLATSSVTASVSAPSSTQCPSA